MRTLFLVGALAAIWFSGACRSPHVDHHRQSTAGAPAPKTVAAGCATCIFDMNGVTGCKLAVEVDGIPYLVTGSGIDDHGDAHAADGLCNARRQAVVNGRIDGERFMVERMKLLPLGN